MILGINKYLSFEDFFPEININLLNPLKSQVLLNKKILLLEYDCIQKIHPYYYDDVEVNLKCVYDIEASYVHISSESQNVKCVFSQSKTYDSKSILMETSYWLEFYFYNIGSYYTYALRLTPGSTVHRVYLELKNRYTLDALNCCEFYIKEYMCSKYKKEIEYSFAHEIQF